MSGTVSREIVPGTIEAAQELLAGADYIADRRLATAVFLSLPLHRERKNLLQKIKGFWLLLAAKSNEKKYRI